MWKWYYLDLEQCYSEHEAKEQEDKPTPPPRQSRDRGNVYHAPLPPPDDMEPQSVCFVQDDAVPISSSDMNSMSSKKSSLHQITSGSKTYRITPESGSPPRPAANKLFSARGHESTNGKLRTINI
jgi:hypothetical protein